MRGLAVLGDPLSDDPPHRCSIAALEDESEAVRTAACAGPRHVPARAAPDAADAGEIAGGDPTRVPPGVSRRPAAAPAGDIPPEGAGEAHAPGPRAGPRQPGSRGPLPILSLIGEFGSDAREVIPALLTALNEPDAGGSAGSNAGPAANDPAIAAAQALARVAGHGTSSRADRADADVPPVREVVPALMKLLESPAAGRRLAAVNALTSFDPDDAVIAALIAIEPRSRRAGPRRGAAGPPERCLPARRSLSLEVLRDALEDDSPEVRAAAASAVDATATGVEPMVPALIRHAAARPRPLGPRDVRERPGLARSAGRHGGGRADVYRGDRSPRGAGGAPGEPDRRPGRVRPGGPRRGPRDRPRAPIDRGGRAPARRPSPTCRPGVVTRLDRGRGQDAYRDALERVHLRRNAVLALGRLAPGTPWAGEAVSALVAALDDPDDEVNLQAIEALVAFGPAAAGVRPRPGPGIAAGQEEEGPLACRADGGCPGPGRPRLARGGRGGRLPGRGPGFRGPADAPLRRARPGDRSARPPRRPSPGWSRSPGEPDARGNEEHASIAAALGQIAPGTPGADQALAALLALLEAEPESPRIETVIGAVARFGPGAAAALPSPARVDEVRRSARRRGGAEGRGRPRGRRSAGGGRHQFPEQPRAGPSPEGL